MKFARHFTQNFTVTVASPAVFTLTDHEFDNGDQIELSTTGALPTGLAVDTTYYVVKDEMTSSTFKVATSFGGTPLNTSGTQSGTHSLLKLNNARLTPFFENNR